MVKGSVSTGVLSLGGWQPPLECHPLFWHILYPDAFGGWGAVGSRLMTSSHPMPRLLYQGGSYNRRVSTNVSASAALHHLYLIGIDHTRRPRSRMHRWSLSWSLLMENMASMTRQVSSNIHELWGKSHIGYFSASLWGVAKRVSSREDRLGGCSGRLVRYPR